MMDGIGQYIMGAGAAAVICALVMGLFPKKDGISGVTRMLCGAMMTMTLLSPIGKSSLEDLAGLSSAMDREAAASVEEGKDLAKRELETVIKSRCEAYILDKAKELGVQISVSITLDDAGLPAGAQISGRLSPYARAELKRILEEDLLIGEAAQKWI
jgi:hypothetical protein